MPATVELRDGSRLVIRPIEPADREALAEGFERMSAESRYLRFFSTVSRLSERQLDYLTEVDHHDHEALVAADAATGEGVAVARYVRVGEDVAEPAIAVADAWQGRGVAGALLDALADRAREEGIRTFAAPVLAQNRSAIAVLERLGEATVRARGREVEIHVDLPERPGAPRPLHEVLRSVVAGSVRPTLAVWQRIATGRPRRPGPPANAIVAGTEERTVRAAVGLAAATDASLHLVSAHHLLLDDRAALDERVENARGSAERAGLDVTAHVHAGDLAAVLIDVAADVSARLLVVDGAAPPALERLIPSVWDHVAHYAPCDVLIVR